jgi:ketosteroid isomerase-like protein
VGARFVGTKAIREGFAARFSGIPDIRYRQDEHFVDGDRGASEWTLSGTTIEEHRIEVRGCDLWTFRDGKVVKKDSYWKIRTTG